ncbi:MAG: sigma 54-interacting transcriptional regulator, partial [Gemmataceae bacterium]|nr:sigma 54-interacting transcriptional regulator [Gemmataceae bacterium]
MAAPDSGPYLVLRREDGYGDVYPLQAGQRITMGRANTNRILVKDELCSREHAEVSFADGKWRVRDLKSLNGTRVNGQALVSDWELTSGDQIQLGRTALVFVERLDELPPLSPPLSPNDSISIRKRLGQTRFLTPMPKDQEAAAEGAEASPGPGTRRSLSRDLALLYRLGLEMGAATTYQDLTWIVLEALLEAVPAEVGAILTMTEGRNLEVTAYRHRDPNVRNYVPVSEFVSNEVLAGREAVLAEDVARDRYLRQRESISHLGATSLICAPVLHHDKVLALIHLYCTDPHKALSSDDLEFTVAVAKHLGIATVRLRERESLTQENQLLRDQLRVESELIGASPAMKALEQQIARVAATNATVLVRGESGVGKELVARAIHYSSPRKLGPFVCLNCAAITETLLESELFGHERGAFTGATEKKIGKFEAAHRGTIFLDEIGEMATSTQAKLLRILEGHPFERVGGSTPIKVDVRVVAATNQPLEKAIQEGKFRRDLFFRLQVVEIRIPPLRERLSDVPLLAEHFLKRFVRETG